MAKAKATVAPAVKKKNWYPILAPKELDNAELGQTYVTDPAVAVGRVVHANLKDITGDMRDQNTYVKFKITANEGASLRTDVIGYYIVPAALKRLARRNTTRIDDSFVVLTKEGQRIRIKPLLVTFHKSVHSVATALRQKVRGDIARMVGKGTFLELVQQLTSRSMQSELKKRLSAIYPLKTVEIKIVEFAREGKAEKAGEEPTEEAKPGAADESPKKKARKRTVTEEMQGEMEGEQQSAGEQEAGGAAEPAAPPSEPEPAIEDTETFGEEET